MIRAACKTVGAHCLHAFGIDRLLGRRSQKIPCLVLCYHRVVEDVRAHASSQPAMLVSLPTLERQLDWVGQRYDLVSLDELARRLEEGSRSTRPPAAVTFDDGYADVYHHGLPLLRRKGVPATIFVVADLVGKQRLHLHDELYHLLRQAADRIGAVGLAALLERQGVARSALRRLVSGSSSPSLVELSENLLRSSSWIENELRVVALSQRFEIPQDVKAACQVMSWTMVQEMQAAGITVGSHTRSHRLLPKEPAPRVISELLGSKQILESALGAEVRHLAYPDGQFSPGCVDAAGAAGYRYAYTTCGHRAPGKELLTIPRRTFWERTCAGAFGSFSPAMAACQVQGVFEAARPCRQPHDRPLGRSSAVAAMEAAS
ncbi:MAG TPA: polysaccharide deacetylase family protein [Thermoanaerobaculia bacterium]|nr:polysaccharide deacetylase family protein [Thermoanaerobaculia bacterium]